jgi:hypothetical protein
LQYFDKKGRKLTIKEAYRQMCWKFHGKGPSHKSKAKLQAKEKAHYAVQKSLNFAGPSVAPTSERQRGVGSALGSLTQRKK